MIDQEKVYLCSMPKEKLAASLYDVSLVQAKCLKARVNFDYSKAHILAILFEKSIVGIKKEQISELKEHLIDDKIKDHLPSKQGNSKIDKNWSEKRQEKLSSNGPQPSLPDCKKKREYFPHRRPRSCSFGSI